jgi:hypothetical protein
MVEHVSIFVRNNKSWTIKNVLANYFRAINLDRNIYREYHSGTIVAFEKLKQLGDILYLSKEGFHLVYKRLLNPRENEFEQADKYTPSDAEMDFINNVGLSFHKAMVARELAYMLEYYETESDVDYYKVKGSLDDYVEHLKILFDKGASLIKPFLRNFQDDVVVLSYFLENERYVESVLDAKIKDLFKGRMEKKIYLKVSEYFLESGWQDRAKKMLYGNLYH